MWVRWLRRAVPRAVLAGILLGLAARLVMRVIAILASAVEGFSWEATLELVVLGIMVGAPLALLFFLVRPRLRLRRPWAGVVYGVVVFVVSAVFPPAAARSAMAGTPDDPRVTAALFAVLWIGFGLLLESIMPDRPAA
ncbi:MAG: hypothetical protein ACT4P7_22805 [Gemmatimonadaceae bacterium]